MGMMMPEPPMAAPPMGDPMASMMGAESMASSGGQITPLGQDYQEIIDHILEVAGRERDEQDKAELMKVAAALQKVLARNQVDAERAMGDSGLGRLVRKAGGGAGY